jgi:hypothetical protein
MNGVYSLCLRNVDECLRSLYPFMLEAGFFIG